MCLDIIFTIITMPTDDVDDGGDDDDGHHHTSKGRPKGWPLGQPVGWPLGQPYYYYCVQRHLPNLDRVMGEMCI